MLRKLQTFLLAINLLIPMLFVIVYLQPSLYPLSHPLQTILPANSTLGFGTIIAVSHAQSPRRASLLWAANLTDVDIVIPEQPVWNEDDLEEFRSAEGSKISRGSALAWMGHLNALKWFLSTPHTTALILEDDTDFSLHIRSHQIPLLAAATRSLFNSTSTLNYWGLTDTWDILYPGHCDDFIAPSTYTSHPSILYSDTSVPAHHILHPDTQNFLSSLNLPDQSRLVHRAVYPFCTFAYAINRDSAHKILSQFSHEKRGGIDAFDVQLLEACRDGWRCWQVSPEVFHHGVGGSEIQKADFNGGSDGLEGEEEQENERATWNIRCGATARGLWVREGDEEGRRRMKDVVRGMVDRGECDIDGMREEQGWRGCEWGECGAQS